MALAFRTHELDALFRTKYGEPEQTGPRPRRRYGFGYFLPDDHYEALVDSLVSPSTRWLDVGGGRHLFPANPKLAEQLSRRCLHLSGVDPSPNILENPFVAERVQSVVQDYAAREPFDLLTLRMVAEHIAEPAGAMEAFRRLLKPGGTLVIYTINKWSPVSILAWLTPFRMHHPVKKIAWQTEEQDTFPIAYRMNTRRTLAKLAEAHGFRETAFRRLDDLSTFAGFRLLNYAELLAWRAFRTIGLTYPENCLLGVYERLA